MTESYWVDEHRFINAPIRIERKIPEHYRLAKRLNQDGEIILQGAYFWQEGNNYGHTWRDIKTIYMEE
jgi:hypothetical protein